MAFNLNKGDEAKKKFDLSKSPDVVTAETNNPTVANDYSEKPKNSKWIFGVLGLILLALVVWFFGFKNKENGSLAKDNVAVIDSTARSQAGDDTTRTLPPVITDTNITVVSNIPDSSVNKSNPQSNEKSPVANGGASNTISTSQKGDDDISSNGAKASASISTSNNSIKNVSTPGLNRVPASFKSGSAVLSNVDKNLVQKIANMLTKNPSSLITINGYASSEGDAAGNQQLSQSRADAFKSYLISKGISGNRITAEGKGITNPIASNESESGRKKNRRVEIILP